MAFLMIENSVTEIPSVEMLCTLGASGSRGQASKIGQFGSGFPYSLALFAREGILGQVKICMGKDVYTFTTEAITAKTGRGDDMGLEKIVMRKQNGGKFPLNISTGFGEIDWTDVTMGIREFVSNAFDGSVESFGNYDQASVTEVADNQCRAKDSTVRIFIPMTQSVRRYFGILNLRFLMLDSSYQPDRRIISNTLNGNAMFYRKGVFVGSMEDRGLFNYNIPDLELKESRNLDAWSAYRSAGTALQSADKATVETVIKSMYKSEETFESKIDDFYFTRSSLPYKMRENYEAYQATWQSAYASIFGPDSLITDSTEIANQAAKKGYHAIVIPKKLFAILDNMGIKKATDILSEDEIDGKEILPATLAVTMAFQELWSKLGKLTANRPVPSLHCYHQAMSGEGQTLGYWRNDTIGIHTDIAQSDSFMLRQTMLEEISHHITKATDNSRDFQDFAFRLATHFMSAPAPAPALIENDTDSFDWL